MSQIDATYLAQLDEVLVDVQVGRDADGTPMLVLGELIELIAGRDGRIDALRRHDGGSLIRDDDAAELSEEELVALVTRRLRLSMYAGGLLGLRFEDAFAALLAA